MSSPGTVTWRQLWAEAATVAGGRPQGRWLCEVAGGFDDDDFLLSLDDAAGARAVAHFDDMSARCRRGEPLQYVLGRWAFRRLDLMVDRRVLIPRPETELLVEFALGLMGPSPEPVLCADLGCGSGAIGLSLAAELPAVRQVWLTDVSADALDVARANAGGLGMAAASVRFARGSWFDALPADLRGQFDLMCSNPPYVGVHDEIEPIVADWEPATALYAGDDGLDSLRVIVAEAPNWLVAGGWLLCEIGDVQGPLVRELFRSSGFVDIDIRPDLGGRDRVAIGRLPVAAASAVGQ